MSNAVNKNNKNNDMLIPKEINILLNHFYEFISVAKLICKYLLYYQNKRGDQQKLGLIVSYILFLNSL